MTQQNNNHVNADDAAPREDLIDYIINGIIDALSEGQNKIVLKSQLGAIEWKDDAKHEVSFCIIDSLSTALYTLNESDKIKAHNADVDISKIAVATWEAIITLETRRQKGEPPSPAYKAALFYDLKTSIVNNVKKAAMLHFMESLKSADNIKALKFTAQQRISVAKKYCSSVLEHHISNH
jgi:hypothetical protein